MYHFSVATAMVVDSLKTMKFVQGHSQFTDIDYKGGTRKFKKYSVDEVLSRKSLK